MSYETAARTAARDGLDVMGALYEVDDTILLLGPARDFWEIFKRSAEMQDGCPDPVDRWSLRVIGRMAKLLNAEALFPFGGPPYEPFLRWAIASGRAWQSPAGMLVHDEAGLMVSYRGALRVAGRLALPPVPASSPCEVCADRPCMSACPVNALSAEAGYQVAACHAYLDTGAGQDCMTNGCKARRACPVSQRFGRDPAQSALHMRSFHPT